MAPNHTNTRVGGFVLTCVKQGPPSKPVYEYKLENTNSSTSNTATGSSTGRPNNSKMPGGGPSQVFTEAATAEPDNEGVKEVSPSFSFDFNPSEGFGHRPSSGAFQIIGIEPPGTPCAHCGRTDGNVCLIRNPFAGVRSEALHEECAEVWFKNHWCPVKGG
jgi:hypothetical protein